jgi:GAF domain-containing protein/ANTAR domain-containing protein
VGAVSDHGLSGLAGQWHDLDAVAPVVLAAAVRLLPVDGGAVLLMAGATRWTAAGTDATVAGLLDLEQTVADGPSVEAYRTGGPVLAPDLPASAAVRWPLLAPALSRLGAYFSLPLRIGAVRLGVLDLYRRAPGRLDDRQLGLALQLADVAATALADRRVDALADPASWPALDDYRPEIDQATGMLSVHLGLDIPAAYARLRAHAFVAGRPLAEVAAAIVAGTLRLDGAAGAAGGDGAAGPQAPPED